MLNAAWLWRSRTCLWKPEQALTSVVMAPLFGVAGDIVIEFDHAVDVDAVCAVLDQTPGVRVGDPVPGPRRGRRQHHLCAHSARSRSDPATPLFTADNLRVGASANALAIATALWSEATYDLVGCSGYASCA